jgi:hypothetical protein
MKKPSSLSYRRPGGDVTARLRTKPHSAFGIERLDEFFERDGAGILRVRGHQAVPVEASIASSALLKIWVLAPFHIPRSLLKL